jgi:ADP-ribose pyrophosphatase
MGKKAGWRILASRYIVESPYLRLRSDSVELPGGYRIEDYYVRESRGFAIVFALTPHENVVLVRQYKHGIGQSVLELPAGGLRPPRARGGNRLRGGSSGGATRGELHH